MPITTSTITGRVPLTNDKPPASATVIFTLVNFDTEGAAVIPPTPLTVRLTKDGELPAGVELWRNTKGSRATHYLVEVEWRETHEQRTPYRSDLGEIQIAAQSSYTLAELLDATPVPTPSKTYWSSITEHQYDAVIDAVAATAADRVQTGQDVIAAALEADRAEIARIAAEAAADASIQAGQWDQEVADAAARMALTGLATNWQVYQLDTERVWRWDGSAWVDRGASPLALKANRDQVATSAQGIKADSAIQPAAGHPIYLYADGSGGSLYDFTDQSKLNVASVSDTIARITDLTGNSELYVPAANTAPRVNLTNGRLAISSTGDTDIIASPVDAPLIPLAGDFTLAWSHRTDSSGSKAVIWQQQSGAVGRTQISANARYTGTGVAVLDGSLQVFIGGVTEGSGPNGMISAANHPIGEWGAFTLIMKEGSRQSELWRNGVLVDRFTRPATFPQVQTTMFRNSGQIGAGQTMGRLLTLHRAPAQGEREMIEDWLRQSYATAAPGTGGGSDGEPWQTPAITSSAAAIWSKPLEGFDSGLVWGKNTELQIRPASMTKLMSAHVGLNWLKKLDAMDTVFERQSGDTSSGSGANLNVGDRIDVRNALANLGLPSSNVTANVWARTIGDLIAVAEGGTGGAARFVSEMNAESARLGMTGSAWMNASGLDATGHLSTATDMARLAVIVGQQHPEITSIWANGSWSLVITGPAPRTVPITHSVEFIANGDPRVLWGKTGTTPLGLNCLLCEFRGPKGNRFYYVGFAATSDAARYGDANAVHAAAASGIEWPSLIPQLRQ